MEALTAKVIVNLTEYPGMQPDTSWVLSLDSLDIPAEEALGELRTLSRIGPTGRPVPNSLSSRAGEHDWGGSSSSAEFLLELSAGGLGALSATAIDAAVRDVFRRLRARARSDSWGELMTEEQALGAARTRIAAQYGVPADELVVQGAEVDAVEGTHAFTFSHADGRSFGAVVGLLKDAPSCMRVWRKGRSGN
ncbi:hypothetical protein AB0D97_05030 [Streptomyces roseus]|uniref:hypothetical protein n=1 Tax=Streptomyces roseus TaxID=66430 RepID=UPI0033FBF18A